MSIRISGTPEQVQQQINKLRADGYEGYILVDIAEGFATVTQEREWQELLDKSIKNGFICSDEV